MAGSPPPQSEDGPRQETPGRSEQTLPDASPAAGSAVVAPARVEAAPARGGLHIAAGSLDGAQGERFAVTVAIGRGATSQVWLAHDRDFDRDIAIKYLPPRAQGMSGVDSRFLHEARITAGLEHPNVVPVYDLGRSADGGLFMVMRRISGRSLGERIRAAVAAGRGEAEPIDAVVTIFRKVCDALAFAHSRGILHRDIKPDNIMLGDYGEVVLVDWGAASEAIGSPLAKGLAGTPAFMSPEQARGEPITPASDVYSLGASLFQTLFLRLPLHTAQDEEFWNRKRSGSIDVPSAREAARVPAPLYAIMLKALAAEPARRYAGIQGFAADLQAWQAGLAVSAWRDPWTVRLRRWHRRHARALWSVAVLLSVLMAFAWHLYGEWLEETATWGLPIISEDFHDPSWRTRWTEMKPGDFTDAGGHLVSQAPRNAFLQCNRRLSGSVAIEFDGHFADGCLPGDLSVVWSDDSLTDQSQPGHARILSMQVGAYDNIAATIITQPGFQRQAYKPMRLEPGRTYRIRVELDGGRATMMVDGATVCTYEDIFPFTSGYFGLYAYYPGKVFDHVRIYTKGLAQKVSALAIGDDLYKKGLYDDAAVSYQQVADSLAGTPLAEQALFRKGLCRLVQGKWDKASQSWTAISDPALQAQVQAHTLDHLFASGDQVALASSFRSLYAGHAELRQVLRNHWRGWAATMGDQPPEASLPLLAIEEQSFPHEADSNEYAAGMLERLGRWDEVGQRFTEDERAEAGSRIGLGRYAELLRHPENPSAYCQTLIDCGMYAQAAEESRRFDWLRRPLLLSTGRFADYVGEFSADERLALMQGRAQDARDLAHGDDLTWVWAVAELQSGHRQAELERVMASIDGRERPAGMAIERDIAVRMLVYLGRSAEALPVVRDLDQRHVAVAGDALEAAMRGDQAVVRERVGTLEKLPWSPAWGQVWFERAVVVPFLDGGREAVARKLAAVAAADAAKGGDTDRYQHHQRLWRFARLVTGAEDDKAFLGQPYKPAVGGALALGVALRHDLAGEDAAAAAGYRAYLVLPMVERGADAIEGLGDPLMERFAQWRLGVVGGK
jgi:tRNA A-37 threonylcarbamoyl transferase component Bud32